MATYRAIQEWVKDTYGWTPERGWIAHCKELCGIPIRPAPNRATAGRARPCPPERVPQIMSAFRHFGMIDGDGPPLGPFASGG